MWHGRRERANGRARRVGILLDRIPLRAVSNALQRDGVKYRAALVLPGQVGAPLFPAVMTSFPPGRPDEHHLHRSGTFQQPGSPVKRISRDRAAARPFDQTASIGKYLHLDAACSYYTTSRNVNVPTAGQGVPNLGRPDPRFANNAQFQSIGRSRFDGLTLALRATPPRLGSAPRFPYTLSKGLDDAGNAFFSTPQDNFNVHDAADRTTISGIASWPTGRGTGAAGS